MDSPIQQNNDRFIKLTCTEDNKTYTAYVRIGSISGIIDHRGRCTVITPEKNYNVNFTFGQLESKLYMNITS